MTQRNEQINYLTANQVIAINTMQIQTFSPQEHIGVREPGLLESALYRPKQTVFENDAYPTIHENSAALTVDNGCCQRTGFYSSYRESQYSFSEIASLIQEHTIKE